MCHEYAYILYMQCVFVWARGQKPSQALVRKTSCLQEATASSKSFSQKVITIHSDSQPSINSHQRRNTYCNAGSLNRCTLQITALLQSHQFNWKIYQTLCEINTFSLQRSSRQIFYAHAEDSWMVTFYGAITHFVVFVFRKGNIYFVAFLFLPRQPNYCLI